MTTVHSDIRMESRQDEAAAFNGLRVHLIGIGGCGMFGAARILLRHGARVTGSDQKPFDGSGELVQAGAATYLGHDASNLRDDVQLVVRSGAVPDSNPEVAAACARGIPVICYAELLGRFTTAHLGVSIAGTHGKSTTTALTAHVMRTADLDPSFIVGAASVQLGGSSGVGRGPHFVVESCEYQRSFLHMRPHSAAILNVEADHLDWYRDIDEIEAAFGAFAQRVDPAGRLLVNHEDRTAKRAARSAECKVETFGFGPGADWRATNLRCRRGCYSFTLCHRGQPISACTLQLAGRHNVSNALAAAALAHEAGAEPEKIVEGLASFEGISRRMSLRGTVRGVTVVDDYAHHPTEIRATLSAVRGRYSPRRTWVVFQPHQASRTRLLLDDFVSALREADFVLVPDIYSVRDTDEDRQAVTSTDVVSRITRLGGASYYVPTFEDVWKHLEAHMAAGDLVVTMGAGDVWKVADGLLERVH